MNRTIKSLPAIFAAACLFVNSANDVSADEIHLYTYDDYLSKKVIKRFKRETGHKVVITPYEDGGVRDKALTSGIASSYDLILLNGLATQIMRETGYIQDFSIANIDNHDPKWQQACGPAGVPYTWGTMGIVYKKSKSNVPITSWRQLFHPPEGHENKIVMTYDHIEAVSAALLAVGANPFSEQQADLNDAYDLLLDQKDKLLAIGDAEFYFQKRKNRKKISMGIGWSGDSYEFTEADSDWEYVVPDEGTLMWNYCWTAPSGDEVSDAAIAFLEFLSEPENAAMNAEYIWNAITVTDAIPLTNKYYREDDVLFPPDSVLSRGYPYEKLSESAMKTRVRMIHKLKQ